MYKSRNRNASLNRHRGQDFKKKTSLSRNAKRTHRPPLATRLLHSPRCCSCTSFPPKNTCNDGAHSRHTHYHIVPASCELAEVVPPRSSRFCQLSRSINPSQVARCLRWAIHLCIRSKIQVAHIPQPQTILQPLQLISSFLIALKSFVSVFSFAPVDPNRQSNPTPFT